MILIKQLIMYMSVCFLLSKVSSEWVHAKLIRSRSRGRCKNFISQLTRPLERLNPFGFAARDNSCVKKTCNKFCFYLFPIHKHLTQKRNSISTRPVSSSRNNTLAPIHFTVLIQVKFKKSVNLTSALELSKWCLVECLFLWFL